VDQGEGARRQGEELKRAVEWCNGSEISMEPREVISLAKSEFSALFGEDGIARLELEEIARRGEKWYVTLSFVRPSRQSEKGQLASYLPESWRRERKVVTLDKEGRLVSVSDSVPVIDAQ
jgi:hypothetical protein